MWQKEGLKIQPLKKCKEIESLLIIRIMVAVPLFRDSNMAAMMLHENIIDFCITNLKQ